MAESEREGGRRFSWGALVVGVIAFAIIGTIGFALTAPDTVRDWMEKAGVVEPDGPTPTDPAPTDPAPTDPAPTDPAPTDPAPTDPAPTDPAPTDPAPTDPAPTDPAPTDPAPTDPAPTDPAPTDPAPTDPAPTDPAPTDPAPTDPAPTDPAPTDPAPTDPAPTDPAPTDPAPTDPAPTDPAPTDPAPTDPAPTDPAPTDPAPTDPAPTDPAPTDPAPTDPAPTDPAPTDPAPTDPAPTDPAPTDPAPTDPAPTDPAPTDPAPTDPDPVDGPGTDPEPEVPDGPDFTGMFSPPGELFPGSGRGVTDDTIFAPGMRFPMERSPAYANTQVWGPGGGRAPRGKPDQCDPINYGFPWRDNFCESRGYSTPACPSGKGHQGQDIRPGTCKKDVHWAVAAESGTITSIGRYTVTLMGVSGREYRYLHLNMGRLAVKRGDKVKRGARLGLVSNFFGGTPTTIHLHFEIRIVTRDANGRVRKRFVPPYTSLVDAYKRLLISGL